MSLRNRLVLPIIFSALAVLAGCGGSSVTITPPPSGGFSNSNLNGTYVFSVTGGDSTNALFQTIAGTFIADGQGNIKSGGFLDFNSATYGLFAAQPITGGRYSVGADGRPGSMNGLLTLSTANNTFLFDYALTSSQHGLITEYDQFGTGSGTLDAQGNVTQTNIDGQSYAFNFTGTSGVGTTICGVSPGFQFSVPLATVGAFTMGASGTNTTTGVQDFNNDCNSAGLAGLPMTSGSVDLSTVPGTASFATGAGTFTFDVYPVDSTHLKFIEIDTGSAILSGDAFTQTSSVPSGNNVLTAAGFDAAFGGFAAAGLINTDGGGNITGSSVEDINDGGSSINEITSGISGIYTAPSGGRALLTFTSGFDNGGNIGCASCQFAAYPSSGGVQLLEIDNAGMTDGTLFAQGNNPTLASAEGYGLNLTGTNLGMGVEEDDIAEFTNNSGTLGPGAIDFNYGVSGTSFKQKFQSTYAADSTVSGRGTVTPVDNSYVLATYGIDGSNQVVVSIDPNLEGLGFMVEQDATAKSSAATAHLALLRHIPGGSKAMKKRNAR